VATLFQLRVGVNGMSDVSLTGKIKVGAAGAGGFTVNKTSVLVTFPHELVTMHLNFAPLSLTTVPESV